MPSQAAACDSGLVYLFLFTFPDETVNLLVLIFSRFFCVFIPSLRFYLLMISTFIVLEVCLGVGNMNKVWLIVFRHIYEIWKENLPLKWNDFFTRCIPIAFTMFVHVLNVNFFSSTCNTFAVERD